MAGGDVTEYFYPPGATEPWVFAWLNFRGVAAHWRRLIDRHGDVLDLDPEGDAVSIVLQIARLYETKAFVDRFQASDLLGRMLAALGRELSLSRIEEATPVRRSQEYLRDHHRRPLNIKEVAARFALSREHFTRLYRQETGRTPAAFLRELRMKTARHLLRTASMPVSQVAEQSGFGSATHFCRAFRKTFGLTPESYRARGKSLDEG